MRSVLKPKTPQNPGVGISRIPNHNKFLSTSWSDSKYVASKIRLSVHILFAWRRYLGNWKNTLGVAKGKNGNRKRLAENGVPEGFCHETLSERKCRTGHIQETSLSYPNWQWL